MDLTRVITGQVVTEKAERQKMSRIYTITVDPAATKIDVKNALKKFYDVDPVDVRVMRTVPKSRRFGANQLLEKRHRQKRMIIKLSDKSKLLDLASFKTA